MSFNYFFKRFVFVSWYSRVEGADQVTSKFLKTLPQILLGLFLNTLTLLLFGGELAVTLCIRL